MPNRRLKYRNCSGTQSIVSLYRVREVAYQKPCKAVEIFDLDGAMTVCNLAISV